MNLEHTGGLIVSHLCLGGALGSYFQTAFPWKHVCCTQLYQKSDSSCVKKEKKSLTEISDPSYCITCRFQKMKEPRFWHQKGVLLGEAEVKQVHFPTFSLPQSNQIHGFVDLHSYMLACALYVYFLQPNPFWVWGGKLPLFACSPQIQVITYISGLLSVYRTYFRGNEQCITHTTVPTTWKGDNVEEDDFVMIREVVKGQKGRNPMFSLLDLILFLTPEKWE